MSNHNLLSMMPGLSGCCNYYKPRAPPRSNTKGLRLTQGLQYSTSVPDLNISADEKEVLGSRGAPIEIPDSPIREKTPCQDHQTQRTKRARDENSDVNPSNNMKKAKLMHQPQNQIINRSQNGRELPLLQIDLNSPALDDDIQFDAKEQVLLMVSVAPCIEESFDDFFYEGESIEDFVGMKVIRVQEEGADGFCHEISVDDFISMEDFGVQETSADGCWYEKESSDDFSGKEEDTGALLESLGFGDLEQYFWGQPESLDDLFKEGEC